MFYLCCQINRNARHKPIWVVSNNKLFRGLYFSIAATLQNVILCFDFTKGLGCVGGWSEIHMGRFNYFSHTSSFKLPQHPLCFFLLVMREP